MPTQQTVNAKSLESRAGKYLSFLIAREEYAIKVLDVREIVKVQHVTPVPDTPASVKGVINLRGKVIPVVDLRLRFGLPEIEYGQRTCIIVVELRGDTSTFMGLIVDEVSEVVNLQDTDVEDTPDFGAGITTPYVLGIAKLKEKVKILLDIRQVLQDCEVCLAEQAIQ